MYIEVMYKNHCVLFKQTNKQKTCTLRVYFTQVAKSHSISAGIHIKILMNQHEQLSQNMICFSRKNIKIYVYIFWFHEKNNIFFCSVIEDEIALQPLWKSSSLLQFSSVECCKWCNRHHQEDTTDRKYRAWKMAIKISIIVFILIFIIIDLG